MFKLGNLQLSDYCLINILFMQTRFSVYSVTQSTRVYRNGPKERKCPVNGSLLDKKKSLVVVRGKRRMARLFQADSITITKWLDSKMLTQRPATILGLFTGSRNSTVPGKARGKFL